jgi:hypothetical protein
MHPYHRFRSIHTPVSTALAMGCQPRPHPNHFFAVKYLNLKQKLLSSFTVMFNQSEDTDIVIWSG